MRWVSLLVVASCACACETDAQAKGRLLNPSTYGSISTRPGLSNAATRSNAAIGQPPADQVRVQAYVEKLVPLDMKQGTYGFDGYLRTWWNDPRLKFNESCTNKLSLSTTERAQIWK